MTPIPKNPPEHYRRNVAIFVVNENGLLLLCERSDIAGAWQLPQGGIEANESVLEAGLRELAEEIGTASVQLIEELADPIRYEWPEALYSRGFRGQEQYYLLVRLEPDAVISVQSLSAEFRNTEWVGSEEFSARIDGFKADAYRRALQQFHRLHPALIAR